MKNVVNGDQNCEFYQSRAAGGPVASAVAEALLVPASRGESRALKSNGWLESFGRRAWGQNAQAVGSISLVGARRASSENSG